jgi:hypothetical protein
LKLAFFNTHTLYLLKPDVRVLRPGNTAQTSDRVWSYQLGCYDVAIYERVRVVHCFKVRYRHAWKFAEARFSAVVGAKYNWPGEIYGECRESIFGITIYRRVAKQCNMKMISLHGFIFSWRCLHGPSWQNGQSIISSGPVLWNAFPYPFR